MIIIFYTTSLMADAILKNIPEINVEIVYSALRAAAF